jgi:hypothetical protein
VLSGDQGNVIGSEAAAAIQIGAVKPANLFMDVLNGHLDNLPS